MKIKRYPNYEISEDGVITRFGRQLKPHINNCGYPVVFLYNNRKRRQEFIHKLLLETFVHKPEESFNQVNHINGIKHDNRLSNLEWCNNSLNQLHAIRIGLIKRELKLDATQIKTVEICYMDGVSIIQLSKYFRVTPPTISRIIKRSGIPRYTTELFQSPRRFDRSLILGENNSQAKITADDVMEILSLSESGLTYKQIGIKKNLSITGVSAIMNGYSWSHITGITNSK